MEKTLLLMALATWLLACPLRAQQPQRADGPLIKGYGAVWSVPEPDFPADTSLTYRVVFEIHSTPDDPAALNPALNTLARFLNMHAQAGVPPEQLHVACVIHGTASKDAMNNEAYHEQYGVDNPNVPLMAALDAAGVQLYICGQSVYARGIDRERLTAPVQVGLSAMTVMLTLQEAGYRLLQL